MTSSSSSEEEGNEGGEPSRKAEKHHHSKFMSKPTSTSLRLKASHNFGNPNNMRNDDDEELLNENSSSDSRRLLAQSRRANDVDTAYFTHLQSRNGRKNHAGESEQEGEHELEDVYVSDNGDCYEDDDDDDADELLGLGSSIRRRERHNDDNDEDDDDDDDGHDDDSMHRAGAGGISSSTSSSSRRPWYQVDINAYTRGFPRASSFSSRRSGSGLSSKGTGSSRMRINHSAANGEYSTAANRGGSAIRKSVLPFDDNPFPRIPGGAPAGPTYGRAQLISRVTDRVTDRVADNGGPSSTRNTALSSSSSSVGPRVKRHRSRPDQSIVSMHLQPSSWEIALRRDSSNKPAQSLYQQQRQQQERQQQQLHQSGMGLYGRMPSHNRHQGKSAQGEAEGMQDSSTFSSSYMPETSTKLTNATATTEDTVYGSYGRGGDYDDADAEFGQLDDEYDEDYDAQGDINTHSHTFHEPRHASSSSSSASSAFTSSSSSVSASLSHRAGVTAYHDYNNTHIPFIVTLVPRQSQDILAPIVIHCPRHRIPRNESAPAAASAATTATAAAAVACARAHTDDAALVQSLVRQAVHAHHTRLSNRDRGWEVFIDSTRKGGGEGSDAEAEAIDAETIKLDSSTPSIASLCKHGTPVHLYAIEREHPNDSDSRAPAINISTSFSSLLPSPSFTCAVPKLSSTSSSSLLSSPITPSTSVSSSSSPFSSGTLTSLLESICNTLENHLSYALLPPHVPGHRLFCDLKEVNSHDNKFGTLFESFFTDLLCIVGGVSEEQIYSICGVEGSMSTSTSSSSSSSSPPVPQPCRQYGVTSSSPSLDTASSSLQAPATNSRLSTVAIEGEERPSSSSFSSSSFSSFPPFPSSSSSSSSLSSSSFSMGMGGSEPQDDFDDSMFYPVPSHRYTHGEGDVTNGAAFTSATAGAVAGAGAGALAGAGAGNLNTNGTVMVFSTTSNGDNVHVDVDVDVARPFHTSQHHPVAPTRTTRVAFAPLQALARDCISRASEERAKTNPRCHEDPEDRNTLPWYEAVFIATPLIETVMALYFAFVVETRRRDVMMEDCAVRVGLSYPLHPLMQASSLACVLDVLGLCSLFSTAYVSISSPPLPSRITLHLDHVSLSPDVFLPCFNPALKSFTASTSSSTSSFTSFASLTNSTLWILLRGLGANAATLLLYAQQQQQQRTLIAAATTSMAGMQSSNARSTTYPLANVIALHLSSCNLQGASPFTELLLTMIGELPHLESLTLNNNPGLGLAGAPPHSKNVRGMMSTSTATSSTLASHDGGAMSSSNGNDYGERGLVKLLEASTSLQCVYLRNCGLVLTTPSSSSSTSSSSTSSESSISFQYAFPRAIAAGLSCHYRHRRRQLRLLDLAHNPIDLSASTEVVAASLGTSTATPTATSSMAASGESDDQEIPHLDIMLA